MRSADPFAVYDGRPLKPRTRYYWSVRVATTGARHGGSSSRGWFETALLTPADWKGAWIAGPERSLVERTPEQGLASDAPIRAAGEFCRPTAWPTVPLMTRVPKDQGECREIRPAPMFRKAFTVGKPVARARLYSSGLGYHDLSVNGARASDSVLDPQFTDYSKTVLYTTADVTALLRPGENVLASELGAGKFDDAARTWDWGWHKAQWRGTPRLRLDLYVTYTDGTELVVPSDDSWRVSVDGPRRYDSTYLGETYDARRETFGWKQAGFDDARWAAARVVAAPAGALRAQVAEPTRVVAERPPGTPTEPVSACLRLRRGAEHQRLGDGPRARTRGHRRRDLLQRDRWKTAGPAPRGMGWSAASSRPTTTSRAARARNGGRRGSATRASSTSSSAGPAATPLPEGVSVSLESVQQVWAGLTAHVDASRPATRSSTGSTRSTDWAIQENNVSGITTDTPIYEKNAWTGDAQLTAGTFSTLYDTERLYRKQIQDMRDAQTAEGEVPHLAPSNVNYGYLGKPAFKPVACCGATPPWDAFWFVVPWEGYQRYGDLRLLESAYPAMQKYLDEWIPRWTDKDGDALALHAHLRAWATGARRKASIPSSASPPPRITPTSRASPPTRRGRWARARTPPATMRCSRASAPTSTRSTWARTASIARRRARPSRRPRRSCRSPSASCPRRSAVRSSLRLVDDITNARGGHEYVGVLGARYILPVLLRGRLRGRGLADRHPDGLPELRLLALARLDVARRVLGGHLPLAEPSLLRVHRAVVLRGPGRDPVRSSPASGRSRSDRRSRRGSTTCRPRTTACAAGSRPAWRKTPSGLQLDVTVPPNATAEVHVPASNPALVREGGGPADKADGVRFQRMVDGRAVYAVGSGEYHFVSLREAPR